jgi:hypothetical protein
MTKRGGHICKVDANQHAIVKALRAAGAIVQPIHEIGKGCPDLLVAFNGTWYVVEVKNGTTLTPQEWEWAKRFSAGAPVWVVHSPEDALKMIGGMG